MGLVKLDELPEPQIAEGILMRAVMAHGSPEDLDLMTSYWVTKQRFVTSIQITRLAATVLR